MKFFCVGEAMIELSFPGDKHTAQVGVAGDALNTAIYLRRRLSQMHNVHFISSVGCDGFSDDIIDFASLHGIECAEVTCNPDRNPGLYAIQTDAEGERSFSYWRDTSAARVMFGQDENLDFSRLKDVDVLFFTGITLAILSPSAREQFLDHVGTLKSKGCQVAFDSNYRPGLWESPAAARNTIDAGWRLANIGLPSIDDETALFNEGEQETQARLAKYGMDTCILKRAGKGPVAICGTGFASPEYLTRLDTVVDSTGAGDSFNGTFLAEYFQNGGDTVSAMAQAHGVAMKVIGSPGAIV